jgi:histidyl-tRNA synthetase
LSRTFRNIKGTFDVLPDASDSDGTHVPATATWRYVEDVIHDAMAKYGAREIRTPMLEPTELVARGVGQLTDIVSKEMFAFQRGDKNYVLRPEITAPVMRAYLQHHLDQSGGVQRLYYIGPCFRAERPQKGRYRQFHQFGLEVIGSDSPVADAETIAAMLDVYAALGITDTQLRINTLGDESSRPRYSDALRDYFEPYQTELSDTSRERLRSNPLRILDTKVPAERKLLHDAPRLIDFVDEESTEHFGAVQSLLTDIGLKYEVDHFLVRGLDYYTRTAFELESPALGAQSALAGGGRYDLLAREIGSPGPVPAVGFAAGLERLFLAMNSAGVESAGAEGPDVFIVAIGDDAVNKTFQLARSIRQSGSDVTFDLLGRSMKAQMREANRTGARFAAILGKDELDRGVVSIKDLTTGDQKDIELSDVESYFTHLPART